MHVFVPINYLRPILPTAQLWYPFCIFHVYNNIAQYLIFEILHDVPLRGKVYDVGSAYNGDGGIE